jgi:Mn2+/Fe2+ NRAMP family transporter
MVGLARGPLEAKAFYATVAVATLAGMVANFVGLDPIRALCWSAVVNGMVATPLLAIMRWIAAQPRITGEFCDRAPAQNRRLGRHHHPGELRHRHGAHGSHAARALTRHLERPSSRLRRSPP